MTPQMHGSGLARPLSGHQPMLVVLATVLAWNVLALAAWTVYVVVSTRQDPNWGDLVAIVSMMLGLGAFTVSLLIGGLVVVFIRRRVRESGVILKRAIGYGSAAAATGLAPFVIYVVIGLLVL
jgi:hypothetical protein